MRFFPAKTILGGCLLAALLSLAPTSGAKAGLIFDVTMDTSNLMTSTDGPFFINFQLTSGSGNVTNTVTISNFDFAGGNPVGSPEDPPFIGVNTGDLSSQVMMTSDSVNPDNDFTQEFAPGNILGFRVSLTTNVDLNFPTQFSFAILYNDGTGLVELPTTSSFDVFVLVDIDSDLKIEPFGTDSSSPVNIPEPSVAVVPEPSTLAMTFSALGLVGLLGWVRSRSSSRADPVSPAPAFDAISD